MDGAASSPEPAPPASTDRADAYEAYWHCLDADDSKASDAQDSAKRSAYEQFWDLVDAD